MKRSPLLVGLAVVGGAVALGVAAFGLYLASLGGYLPWQVDPTPISAGITPFAGLGGSTATPRATSGTPAAPGSTPVGPGASPVAFPAGTTVFRIVGEQSAVRYVVNEQLAGVPGPTTAIGETTAIAGEIGFDAAGVPIAGSTFQVDLRTIKSDRVRRDNDVKRFFLETDMYPIATFTVTGVEGLAGGLADGQPVTFTIIGDLTAHGVTKSIRWTASATLSGDTLAGRATTEFPFAEFDMKVPSIIGMVSARDPVRLEVEIVAARQT